jgi:hypothetical protein
LASGGVRVSLVSLHCKYLSQPNPTRPETGRVLESYSSWPWPKVNAKPNRPWWGALCPPAPSPLTCACLLASFGPCLSSPLHCTQALPAHCTAYCICMHCA